MLKNRVKRLEKKTAPGQPMPKQQPGETDMKYLNRVVGSFTGKAGRPVKDWDPEKGDPKEYVLKKMAE